MRFTGAGPDHLWFFSEAEPWKKCLGQVKQSGGSGPLTTLLFFVLGNHYPKFRNLDLLYVFTGSL